MANKFAPTLKTDHVLMRNGITPQLLRQAKAIAPKPINSPMLFKLSKSRSKLMLMRIGWVPLPVPTLSEKATRPCPCCQHEMVCTGVVQTS